MASGETFRLGRLRFVLKKLSAKVAPPKISIGSLGVVEKILLPNQRRRSSGKREKKHQVLLVDDSMAFLGNPRRNVRGLERQDVEIHKASAADQALVILQQHQIELAVHDINMPMLDGVAIARRDPAASSGCQKLILTGQTTDAHRTHCPANGELFLEKPVASDGFVSIFNLLNDLFVWSQREDFPARCAGGFDRRHPDRMPAPQFVHHGSEQPGNFWGHLH